MKTAELVPNQFPCLVWLQGAAGVEPQIWYSRITKDQQPVKVLQFHSLSEADLALDHEKLQEQTKLSFLAHIAALYPYEENVIGCPSAVMTENVKADANKPVDRVTVVPYIEA